MVVVRETQTGGGVLENDAAHRLPEVSNILKGILRECSKATKEFSDRKASSKIASVKWVLEFLGKVSCNCERTANMVAEVSAAGEITRWREAPRRQTKDRGVQCSNRAGGDTGIKSPQRAPNPGEGSLKSVGVPTTVDGQQLRMANPQQVTKRQRTSPSPQQEAPKKRAVEGEGSTHDYVDRQGSVTTHMDSGPREAEAQRRDDHPTGNRTPASPDKGGSQRAEANGEPESFVKSRG